MKKIMTALLCALGFSLVSQAEKISGTNFEGLDVGFEVIGKTDDGSIQGGYWSNTVNGVEALVATNTFTMVEVPPQEEGGDPTYDKVFDIVPYSGDVGYPSVHGNADSENYLSINTKGGELVRNIQEGGTAQTIGNGIYFDSMVQFTSTDSLDASAGSADDKLIVWLRENGDGTTNLVVTAGYLNDEYTVTRKDYVVLNSVQADKWYRLTIQAITGAITAPEKPYVGYAIFIDGVKAEYAVEEAAFDGESSYEVQSPYSNYLYNSNIHALFPSLKSWDATGVNTFTAVAFSGVGAVDDIMFTTNAYDVAFTAPPASLTVDWTVGIATVTITRGEEAPIVIATEGVAGSTNITEKGSYTIAATVQTGYVAATVSQAQVTIENTEETVNVSTVEGYAEINGTLYATLAEAVAAAQSGATVKLYKGNNLGDATLAINNQNAFVLDLNGQVLSGSNSDAVLSVGNNLTIIDSVGGGAISNTTENAAVLIVSGSLVVGLAENDMGASFYGMVGPNGEEPFSIVRGNFYSDDAETIGGFVAQGSVGDMIEGCYVVAPVTIGLDPAVVELYYNCTSQISVVGAPAGSTFYWQEEVIPGESTGTGSISFSGDKKPLSIRSGRKTDTVKFNSTATNGTWHLTALVTNDNVEVAQLVANVVVRDVAAVVDGVEYSRAQFAQAIADAIAQDEVLGIYISAPNVVLAAGETLKVKNLNTAGTATLPTVTGPEGTAQDTYVVNKVKDTATGVTTFSLTVEEPSVMFVSADGSTTNYFDAAFKATAAGTYKLLKNITRGQLSVGTAGVVLDLNGKTFTSTATGTSAAILVTSTIGTAGFTVKDTSDAGTGAIVAPNYSVLQSGKNGTVVVEGGSLSGNTVIVYTVSGGTATISGGKFQMVSGSADAMLNCKDDNKGTISVTGGEFYGFNPADNTADGAGTDYVAEGYVSTANKPSTGWYTVEVEVPAGPTVDGNPVDTDKVFEEATSDKPIVYPTAPTVTTDSETGSQTITYGGQTVDVPAYYTATPDGNTVTLELNNKAVPAIEEATISEETKPAMEVTGSTTAVTLGTTSTKLYYGLVSADAPNSDDLNPASAGFTVPALTQGTGNAMQISIPIDSNETSKFYKVYVTDIAPASGN